ncbi:MAG: hypothetical protein HEP70_19120 [Rhodobiaceae bacterium]|nr:hypothetical protein [Rhodobiaceae bacterium]
MSGPFFDDRYDLADRKEAGGGTGRGQALLPTPVHLRDSLPVLAGLASKKRLAMQGEPPRD